MPPSVVVALVFCCFVFCYGDQQTYDGSLEGYELLGLNIASREDAILANGLRQKFPELDYWTEPVPGTESILLVPRHLVSEVKSKVKVGGVGYRVVSTDVQGFVDASYVTSCELHSRRRRQATGDVIDHTNYHSLAGIRQSLNRLKAAYRGFLDVENIGPKTSKGRRLMLVKVHTPRSMNKKPVVVLECGIHGREWISPAAGLFFIEKLLKDYRNHDVTARQMLDRFDWYLLPVANPDGYLYTWSGRRKRHWRKNRHRTSTCMGVDLNRNFPVNFGVPENFMSCGQNYPGESAFSEAETQAIRDLVQGVRGAGRRMAAYVSLHNYGQILLVPWGWNGTRTYHATELARVGEMMTTAIYQTHGLIYRYGTVSQHIGHNVSGSCMDWILTASPGAYTYSFELRPRDNTAEGSVGFLLNSSQIVPTGEEFYAAMAVMSRAMRLSEGDDRHTGVPQN